MSSSKFLSVDEFSNLVAIAPLISIDLIVTNDQDEILLGKRDNKPAKNFWFVPGGRILKNETLDNAFKRLTHDELGIDLSRSEAIFLNIYEHFYSDSCFGDNLNDPTTHYVVLAHKLVLEPSKLTNLPNNQHSIFRWWNKQDALASDEVHIHTKWYI